MDARHQLATACALSILACLPAVVPSPAAAAPPPPGVDAASSEPAAGQASAVACKLTPAEKRQRVETLRSELFPRVHSTAELEHGWRFTFARTDGEITRVAEFIALESECCPFLSFALSVPADSGAFELSVTGPEGTKELLRSLIEDRAQSIER